MSHDSTTGAPRRSVALWLIALGMLCLASIGYGFLFSTNAVSDPAFIVGYYLPHALLFWALFYAVFLRKRGAKTGLVSFAAIYAALLAGAFAAVSQQRQAMTDLHGEMMRIVDEGVDSNGVPSYIEVHPVSEPQAKGELAEVEVFIGEFMHGYAVSRNDCLSELDAIGWNTILDASRLRDDTDLADSKKIIQKARQIVDKYERKGADLLRAARARIQTLNVSGPAKKEMCEGFDLGMERASSLIAENWNLERKAICEVENIIVLLARTDTWTAQGSQVVFSDEAQFAEYKSRIESIQEIVQRQEEIRQASRDELDPWSRGPGSHKGRE